MNFLLSIFRGPSGRGSSIRVLMVLGVIAILGVWCFVSISKCEVVEIPLGVQAIVGILVAGKAAQRFGEKGEP
jgi:hypothetical protein